MSRYLYMGLGALVFALGYIASYATDPLGFYAPPVPTSIELPFNEEALTDAHDRMILQILQPVDGSLQCETNEGLPGPCEDMDTDYVEVPESPNYPDIDTVKMLNRMGVEHSIAIL